MLLLCISLHRVRHLGPTLIVEFCHLHRLAVGRDGHANLIMHHPILSICFHDRIGIDALQRDGIVSWQTVILDIPFRQT